MTDLTPERREENMRLRDAATPGPYERWVSNEHMVFAQVIANERGSIRCNKGGGEFCRCDEDENPKQGRANAAYIVAACNDLPLYEAALAEREREIERLKYELQAERDIRRRMNDRECTATEFGTSVLKGTP